MTENPVHDPSDQPSGTPPQPHGSGNGQPGGIPQPGGTGIGGSAPGTVPGPGLAQALAAAAGGDGAALAGLADSGLLEVIAGGRQMASWGTWVELAAMAVYGARHPAGKGDPGPFARGAADEVGFATALTWTSAAARMAFGAAAGRLPATFAAMRDGNLDPVHAKIIEEYTAVLSAEDAAEADKILAAAAASGLTYGQLRARAARVVLRLDPDAASRRREAARREASVRAYREESGNAGISGRELPADEVLASFQNIEEHALDLRALGVEGSLQELKVLAMLDLLQERDSTTRLPAPGQDAPQDTEPPHAEPGDDHPQYDEPDDDGEDNGDEPRPPGGAGPAGPHSPAGPGGTRLAAQVTIVVPYQAWAGLPSGPGEAAGFGLIDPAQIPGLLAAAARHPDSRGCITLLGPDGTAAAHGCGRGRFTLPPPATGVDKPDSPDPPEPPGTRKPTDRAGPAWDIIARLRIRLAPVTQGPCDHRAQEPRRLPSRKLRHLVSARSTTCTAPGCGRPALRCEQDHTLAWEDGGISCECNLGPLCKHHHIIKHLNHWLLEQPEPGTFTWRTPAGRTYTTRPAQY